MTYTQEDPKKRVDTSKTGFTHTVDPEGKQYVSSQPEAPDECADVVVTWPGCDLYG